MPLHTIQESEIEFNHGTGDFPALAGSAGAWTDVACSLGSTFCFCSRVGAVSNATPETIWVETWRMFGFLVFTGMFLLLALRPRNSAGMWELAFFHKTAMAVSTLFLL